MAINQRETQNKVNKMNQQELNIFNTLMNLLHNLESVTQMGEKFHLNFSTNIRGTAFIDKAGNGTPVVMWHIPPMAGGANLVKIPMGGKVIEWHTLPKRNGGGYDIILVEVQKNPQPYVTWARNAEDGGCFWGHYFSDLEAAEHDFQERISR